MTEVIIAWAIVAALYLLAKIAKQRKDKHAKTIRLLAKISVVVGVYWSAYYFVSIWGFFEIPDGLILLFILTAMKLDMYLTENALLLGASEANLLMAYLFKKIGLRKTDIVSFPFIAGFAIVVALYSEYPIKIAVSIMYTYVIVNNFLVYNRRKKTKLAVAEV